MLNTLTIVSSQTKNASLFEKVIPKTTIIGLQTKPLRPFPTHKTILVSQPHYFSVISILKTNLSPTTTLNFTLKTIL